MFCPDRQREREREKRSTYSHDLSSMKVCPGFHLFWVFLQGTEHFNEVGDKVNPSLVFSTVLCIIGRLYSLFTGRMAHQANKFVSPPPPPAALH